MKVVTIIFLFIAFTGIALAECTIDQIEKMQNKGLSWDEIKEICGNTESAPSKGISGKSNKDTRSSSRGRDDLLWPEDEDKEKELEYLREKFNRCKLEAIELQSAFIVLRNEYQRLCDPFSLSQSESFTCSINLGAIVDSIGKRFTQTLLQDYPLQDAFNDLEDCRMTTVRLKGINESMPRLIEELRTKLGK